MKQCYNLCLLRIAQIFCFFLTLTASAQVQTARYIKITSKVNAYWEYLPKGYNPTSTKTYPLMLTLPGFGNMGNGSPTELPRALDGQVGTWIRNGNFPDSFVVKGQIFRFIVITPQFIKSPWPDAKDIDSVLNFVVQKYRVDLKRIYLTGLSYGGGLCWEYISASSTYANRIAAIAPSASTANLSISRSRVAAAANVAVWATHNDRDPMVGDTNTINTINRVNASPAPYPFAKYTIFKDTVHDAWHKAYDPRSCCAYRENGLNVYEWLLQYQRISTTTSTLTGNIAPRAKAGADKIITTPTNSIKLYGTGSDADDSVTYYSWAKISGPARGYVKTSGLATTTMMDLVPGTYLFQLSVADSRRAIGRDTVQVIVNMAPKAYAGTDKSITLPTNYVNLSGSGSDADGSIASYKWSKVSGPSYYTFSSSTTAATRVSNLVAGSYVFRLTVKDNRGGTAYDDVVVTVKSATAAVITLNNAVDEQQDSLLQNSLQVFPNPVQGAAIIELNNKYQGSLTIELLDWSGRVLREVRTVKDQEHYRTSLWMGELTKGGYLLRVQGVNWKAVTKITKL